MGEPLELTAMIVDLALRPSDTVVLVVVNEEYDFLPEPTAEVVELHALPVVHVAVGIALLEQERRLQRIDGEHGGIANVRLRILPERNLHPLLASLVVAGLGKAGVERRVTVHAD